MPTSYRGMGVAGQVKKSAPIAASALANPWAAKLYSQAPSMGERMYPSTRFPLRKPISHRLPQGSRPTIIAPF